MNTDAEKTKQELVAELEEARSRIKRLESNRHYFPAYIKDMLNAMPDLVSLQDPNYNIVYSNWKGLGAIPQERRILGGKCYKVYRGFDRPCPDCMVDQVKKTGKSMHAQLKSVEGPWVEVTEIPLIGEDGQPEFFMERVQDITEQKEFAQRLQQSEKRLRGIFDSVEMVAVQGYDHERNVIFWNKSSEILYGYTKEEALGRKLEGLIIPDEMRQGVVRAVDDWIKGGPPIPAGELTLRHKDGSPVYVHSSHVMQAGISGHREIYCIDVDLAEVKKAHRELVRAKELAETANSSKSEFLANMSHEIRTPMNGILGMFQLLETTGTDEEQNEYIQMGLQSSKRLTSLLSDILDLSKVEAGKLAVANDPFDLAAMLRQVNDLYRSTVNSTGVKLEMTVDPGLAAPVLGDSLRVQQVLVNLLGNAFKFTRKGKVTLTAYRLAAPEDEIKVLFCVSDTGIGIPDDKLSDIFKHFTQLGQGLNRNYQGAGLGLSICKHLVNLMGGNIAIESEVGKGTKIYVNLKFASAHPVWPKSSDVLSLEEIPGAVTRVLLVEDDYVSQITAQKQMEKVGCGVVAVDDGQKALEALRQNDFDLVLMDVQMPVMDGVEATKAIRQGGAGADKAGIPIVAMTAYAMMGDKQKFLEAGMTHYLSKPIDFKEFMVILAKARANEL